MPPRIHSWTLRTTLWLFASGSFFCVCLPGCFFATPTPEELVKQCRTEILESRWEAAGKFAEQVPAESKRGVEIRIELAEAATREKEYTTALAAYQGVRSQKSDAQAALKAVFYASEIERELGQLSVAESGYRQVLDGHLLELTCHARLSFLLTISGRGVDSIPNSMAIVKSGNATYRDLAFLADLNRPFEAKEYLQGCLQKYPEDWVVALGIASHQFWEGEIAPAEQSLRQLAKTHGDEPAVQGMLGESLLTGDPQEFWAWHRALPPQMDHCHIWYVRGVWARKNDQLEIAAHCFWQAIRRSPVHRPATTQLSQVLTKLGHPSAPDFAKRTSQMARITQLIDAILTAEGLTEAPIREMTSILDETGRIWEACGWGMIAEKSFPQTKWPAELFARRGDALTETLPQVDVSQNLALRYDLSSFPGFEQMVPASGLPVQRSQAGQSDTAIRFEESAKGLAFEYFSGPDPETQGARMFEQTGGGACVIDYDMDGGPDLFFPQGKEWKTGSRQPTDSPALRDTLYRHTSSGYRKVTGTALPADHEFGQGAAAGDFDNDGFPDLYVGNVGRNQLLHNMGDGTFEDVTDLAGLTLTDWTASTLMSDLNADGFPDLFDVNYVSGDVVYEAICKGHACSPKVFPGTPARLYLSQGDGTFQFVPNGPTVQPGKGLGVVCLPLETGQRPGLFISNDQVANQLLRNRSASPQGIEFADEAMVSGIAFNGDGVAMAGMGIAAEDIDGNGLTDLFVTNFKDEPNSLFLQDSPGLFVDATNASGLKAASMDFVGWGTQFLDADRDSLPDLVIANGHVDDYRDEGGVFEMRPQFFHQVQGGRFVEMRGTEVGPFFDQLRRGRGLSRLDWNQDGLMDFVVSQIGNQASLVSNVTRGAGHFVNVKLVATTTARDATGSRVLVTAGEQSHWTKYMLAGDGYMAANERVLQFGLGKHADLKEVQVVWPSGAVSRISSPPLDGTLLVIEGSPSALSWNAPVGHTYPVEVVPPPPE